MMTRVWEEAGCDGGALIVLLALADWANDSGVCFPKIPAIARKSRLTPRQVHNIIKQFRDAGVLSIQPGGGRGRSNSYRINSEKLSVNLVSVKSEAETLKFATRNPEICDSAKSGLDPEVSAACTENRGGNRQEPSIEPSDISSNSAESDAPQSLDTALNETFSYYLSATGKNGKTYTFTPARRRKGVARLKECLTKTSNSLPKAVGLMKLAIDELAASDWHMGRDPKTNGKRYCDWDGHLFKSYERMEEWWNS